MLRFSCQNQFLGISTNLADTPSSKQIFKIQFIDMDFWENERFQLGIEFLPKANPAWVAFQGSSLNCSGTFGPASRW